jgi:hypothetical protein
MSRGQGEGKEDDLFLTVLYCIVILTIPGGRSQRLPKATPENSIERAVDEQWTRFGPDESLTLSWSPVLLCTCHNGQWCGNESQVFVMLLDIRDRSKQKHPYPYVRDKTWRREKGTSDCTS